jgi:hypothetical protein
VARFLPQHAQNGSRRCPMRGRRCGKFLCCMAARDSALCACKGFAAKHDGPLRFCPPRSPLSRANSPGLKSPARCAPG